MDLIWFSPETHELVIHIQIRERDPSAFNGVRVFRVKDVSMCLCVWRMNEFAIVYDCCVHVCMWC